MALNVSLRLFGAPEDAVRAYTRGSAYAGFADGEVGTLRVTMTMVGGKVVYAK
jgi:hypothetical protein